MMYIIHADDLTNWICFKAIGPIFTVHLNVA